MRAVALAAAAVAVTALASAAPAQAAAGGSTDGARSNLGLCSPFLAGLPAPVDPVTGATLGGNARSGVNLLIQRYGEQQPDHLANPGQLYRVRAHEHPTDSAAEECLPRPRP